MSLPSNRTPATMAESKAPAVADDTYVMEEKWIDEGDDEAEDFAYFEDDDDLDEEEDDEDLETALATLKAAKGSEQQSERRKKIKAGDPSVKTSLR